MANPSVPRAEWPFIEVLSDDQSRDLETINVYAAVVEPQQTKTVLGYVYALSHYDHRPLTHSILAL